MFKYYNVINKDKMNKNMLKKNNKISLKSSILMKYVNYKKPLIVKIVILKRKIKNLNNNINKYNNIQII